MAQAIDNSGLTNYRDRSDTSSFNPAIAYVFDANAETVTCTISTTGTTPVEQAHIRVHDKFGGEVRGEGSANTESGETEQVIISTADLDASKPYDITATVLANDGKWVADGGAYNIGAAGSLGSWDKQVNA